MSKTILTKEQEQEIIQKYNSGISKNALHLEYKVSEGTIKRALQRNNIPIRQIQETNVSHYYINSAFFEKDKRSTIPKYRLYCYSKKRCKQIFELLYANNPKLKMQRKYEKFLFLLNE